MGVRVEECYLPDKTIFILLLFKTQTLSSIAKYFQEHGKVSWERRETEGIQECKKATRP